MKRTTLCLALILTLGLLSCGGEGPGLAGARNGSDTGGGTDDKNTSAKIHSLDLLASSPQLQSDGSEVVTLSAITKDSNNRVIGNVPVTFSATSGALNVIESNSTDQGLAIAELSTGGDPSNQTINVTASAGGLEKSIDIAVVGSAIHIQGPSSVVNGDTAKFVVTLTNAAGNGIANKRIDVESTRGNALTASTVTTDYRGRVEIALSGDVAGADTLTAFSLPDPQGNATVKASVDFVVSDDNFRFTKPKSGREIELGANENVTVSWLDKDGNPVVGSNVRFAISRGTLSASSAVTDADGNVTISVSSSTAGPAVITATNTAETSTQLDVEFVATEPAHISLQAEPGVITTNESSTITAVVQDANNNRVKNAVVEFSLSDTTGGSLSTASVKTDSTGRAQTVFTSTSVTSANDGVVVTGRVAGSPLQAETSLTVSGRALFITFGTGNSIIEDGDDTIYTKNYSLFISDASGKGVPNVKANLRMLPTGYRKGYLEVHTGDNFWSVNTTATCQSEDLNGNGILDTYPVNEDLNGDGELSPGNIAIVSPGTVTTDEDGRAVFSISYPQNYAYWVIGRITASATVAGTESRTSANFGFPASASDMSASNSPPNPVSPWGISASCSDTF